MYMSVLLTCVSVYDMHAWCVMEVTEEQTYRLPWSYSCGRACGCWELDLGALIRLAYTLSHRAISLALP